MKTIETGMFFWDKKYGFSQEASTLNMGCPPKKLKLVNPKTNGSRVFKMVSIDKDREGDIGCWNFRTDDGIELTIFND